jgi:DNA-binding transcriptional LysR family regulator
MLDQVTCASAEYLSRHGMPVSLDALAGHQAVNFFSTQTGRSLPFEFVVEGRHETLQLGGKVSVNSAQAYVACCAAGFGLIQVPRYHVAPLLQSGSLIEVLTRFVPPPLPVTVLYPHARQLSPRVRVFVDWVADAFSSAP